MGKTIIIQPIGEKIMSKIHLACQDDTKRTAMEKGRMAEAKEQPLEELFAITEIKIEEISIDGICGVY
jgi:mycofactocin precursor